MKPGKQGANKDAKIYVGRSTTLHNLFFCAHTLCVNYVRNRHVSALTTKLELFLGGP